MKTRQLQPLLTPEVALEGKDSYYPRPQLRRDSYLSLNGIWEFSVTPQGIAPQFDQIIQVPYPPASVLSGVKRIFPDGTALTYRRQFTLPPHFHRGRVLLHVGAADQVAKVWVNGREAGEHIGGYLPFTLDITPLLLPEGNTVIIAVTDHMEDHILPYGKQTPTPGGMWYTPVSGIWQSVWLESVPEVYVKSLRITADEKGAVIRAEGVDEAMLLVTTPEGMTCVKMREGVARIPLETPRLWSPEDPYLYRFKLIAGEDTVYSYFACRTLSVKAHKGVPRLCLNGRPYFFHGLLDQGYFPDGIFTPAHPVRYEKDILFAKFLGFNTLRKHIKIEPEQFYYDCDRLGMAVFQDMVNNGDYSFLRDTALPTLGLKKRNDKRLHRDPQGRQAFLKAMEETVNALYNHPSVCYWTIFNEGWGQFDGDGAYHKLRSLDDTRFIDTASGWFHTEKSDVESPHVYFKPYRHKTAERPTVLSEFGGYSLPVAGHVANTERVYGYRKFTDKKAFNDALIALYENEVLPAAEKGLSGAIYTQLTDVEDEINGLLTYDRKESKADAKRLLALAERLKNAGDGQKKDG